MMSDELSFIQEFVLRICWLITALVTIITFICCFVQASHDPKFYVPTFNLIVTCYMISIQIIWYKQTILKSWWYMMLMCFVMNWQCIVTDVYVFSAPNHQGHDTNDTNICHDKCNN